MKLDARQQACLHEMGIDVWRLRGSADAAESPADMPMAVEAHAADDAAVWTSLQETVSNCTLCELHKGRTHTVFGVGDSRADWLLIGEAPGAEEDRQGEPFVGRAGQLLNNMIRAIGLDRESVFIANILKCRPPNNRDPRPEEVTCCEPYLRQQIAMIQPKIILALGRVAAQNLLKVSTPIGKMRGQKYVYPGTDIPVLVTYHPAYLLRSPSEKRKSWQDLQMAVKLFRELQ